MDEERPRPGQPTSDKQSALSKPLTIGAMGGLLYILRNAGRGGCVDVTSHFKMRAAQRGFSTPEALSVLRHGTVISGPDFCAEFCNWKFSVELEQDDEDLVIVAGVCAGDAAQVWSKNVMLITGFFR